METFSVAAIGRVASSRQVPIDDDWDSVESAIELDAAFDASALRGLAEFSHIEVVYLFHLVDPAAVTTDARRPRDGTRVRVSGLDAIDGTPVLDIKPYMREFGPRGEVSQPHWAAEIMGGYF